MDFNIWTMRDGKQIHIQEMTTLHVKNCLGMLKRSLEQKKIHGETIKILSGLVSILELKKDSSRNEKILDRADSDLMIADCLLEESTNFTKNWILIFEEELKKRETN